MSETPTPPYYAVIFTTRMTSNTEGYEEMASRMEALASQQPGYLGIESARNETGITVSYWKDLDSIRKWKENAEHTEARELGRSQWYQEYTLRVCKVEREYSFQAD